MLVDWLVIIRPPLSPVFSFVREREREFNAQSEAVAADKRRHFVGLHSKSDITCIERKRAQTYLFSSYININASKCGERDLYNNEKNTKRQ